MLYGMTDTVEIESPEAEAEAVEAAPAAPAPVEPSEEDHLAAGDVFCCNKWMTPDEVAACKATKHEAEAAAVVDWRTPR